MNNLYVQDYLLARKMDLDIHQIIFGYSFVRWWHVEPVHEAGDVEYAVDVKTHEKCCVDKKFRTDMPYSFEPVWCENDHFNGARLHEITDANNIIEYLDTGRKIHRYDVESIPRYINNFELVHEAEIILKDRGLSYAYMSELWFLSLLKYDELKLPYPDSFQIHFEGMIATPYEKFQIMLKLMNNLENKTENTKNENI